jgi:hypothetical protein
VRGALESAYKFDLEGIADGFEDFADLSSAVKRGFLGMFPLWLRPFCGLEEV